MGMESGNVTYLVQKYNKYKDTQIINHVNAKNGERKINTNNEIKRPVRGMPIKKKNGEIIEMRINYGRICIVYNDTTGNGDFVEVYNCNTRGKERPSNGGIKTHLSQVSRDMIQSYGLISPYCVETFLESGNVK